MSSPSTLKIRDFKLSYMKGTPFESLGVQVPEMELELSGIYGVLGSTGSGKSTFCKLLAGLAEGSSDVLVTPWKWNEHRQQCGFVFQQPEHQVFEETVEDELTFALRNFGFEEYLWSERVAEAMGLVGLPLSFLKRDPQTLSGGEKRRVALASILAYQPRLLILDEPMAGIDGMGKKRLLETILTVARNGVTIFWVSHDLNDLLRYADRCLYFESGTLKEFGDTHRVLFNSQMQDSYLLKLMRHLVENENWTDPVPSEFNLESIRRKFGYKVGSE